MSELEISTQVDAMGVKICAISKKMPNKRTIGVIEKIVSKKEENFSVDTGVGRIKVSILNPDKSTKREVEVHCLESGDWMQATWKKDWREWQSADFTDEFRGRNRNAVFCAASTLGHLDVSKSIKTYASAICAVRSIFEAE